jgi:hypothetical protein
VSGCVYLDHPFGLALRASFIDSILYTYLGLCIIKDNNMSEPDKSPTYSSTSTLPSSMSTRSKSSSFSSSSITNSTSSCRNMHQKLTGQMQAQQERWAAWQERQIECYQSAVKRSKADPCPEDALQAKREHPHLDKFTSALRRMRG